MDDARDDTHTTALRTGEDPTLPQHVELAAVGDRCVACGAPLSSDQRYCVNCGERRTAPRFTLAAAAAPAAETVTTVTHRSSPRRRASSGTAMVAGIGTLLLAMGVGVLIGRTNSTNTGSQRAAAPNIHVTVGGGTGGGSSSAATTQANSNAGTHRSGATSSKASAAAAAKQAATAKKAAAAAGKVLGSGSKNLPPPNVAVGSTGSGAGYSKKTHKFTGTFFGQ